MKAIVAFVCLALSYPIHAQSTKSTLITSNGTEVTLYADEFADRFEFTAPPVKIDGGGFALVGATKKKGVVSEIFIAGSIYYRGDWRFYNSAIFKGGETANAVFNDRNVVSCSGSRYGGGCSMREGFDITVSPAQLKKYAENGIIQIQLRSKSAYAQIISIPVNYFEAIKEVAK